MPQFTISGRDKIWRQVKHMFLGLDISIQHMKLKKKVLLVTVEIQNTMKIFHSNLPEHIIFFAASNYFFRFCFHWSMTAFLLSQWWLYKSLWAKENYVCWKCLIGQNRCHLIYSDLAFTFTRGFVALIICLGSVPAINIQLIIFLLFLTINILHAFATYIDRYWDIISQTDLINMK